jgi:PLP dependent protein
MDPRLNGSVVGAFDIAERLREQKARLERAASQAGRDPSQIKLVAVSKKHDVEAIRAAYSAGQRDFGENYVQELIKKAEELSQYADIRWHLIGHLQSNKARFVANLVHCIQTVDSAKLAQELGGRVKGTALAVLIEVNVSGELSKSGCSPAELLQVIESVEAQSGLALRGLMTMPPYDPDPERARPYFERLFELREKLGGEARLAELSMGMSHDLEVAVRAGATIVRVGSAIFGERGALAS